MPFPVTINGKTYQQSDFTPYGYVTSFPNIVQDIATVGDAANAIVSAGTYGNSFRNRLRNADFSINQRAVSGTVTLAAGAYGHDGFKAGANGCTYTFARSGGITTLTISAGSLIQVVEGGLYLTEGGTYALSWVGTAGGRINASSGSFVASPIVATGLAADANAVIEWGTGTLALPMFEPGNKRTVFERRDDELRRCQRYYCSSYPAGVAPGSANAAAYISKFLDSQSSYSQLTVWQFPVPMRANPTVIIYSPVTGATGAVRNTSTNADLSASTFGQQTNVGTNIEVNNATVSAGNTLTAHATASAEL